MTGALVSHSVKASVRESFRVCVTDSLRSSLKDSDRAFFGTVSGPWLEMGQDISSGEYQDFRYCWQQGLY